MQKVSRLLLGVGSAGLGLIAASAAWAQDTLPATPGQSSTSQTGSATPEERSQGLDDIVVTASRTGETKAQRTPVAISVLSGDRLNSALAVNVKDLVQITPNLSVAQTTASAQIYIRGIGSSNVYAGSDPDVTVQSDGVYIARAFGQFTDFVDVQRIEVLRGPQGTLYGRNAVGGTINIISRLPTDEFHAKAQITAGDYGLFQEQTYASGPLIPGRLQASLATNYIRHDDYFKNVVPNVNGTENANRGGVRGQLRFEASDTVELISRADYSQGSEHVQSYDHLLAPVSYAPLASSLIGNSLRLAEDQGSHSDTKLWGVAEEINIRLGDTLALKSLTAARKSQYKLIVDQDATEIAGGTSGQFEVSRQVSQEFNLTLNTRRIEAVAGLFYFHDHDSTTVVSNIPPSLRTPAARSALTVYRPETYTESYAAFAQGTFHFNDRLSATAGLRYTRDTRSIDQNVTRVSLNPATFGTALTGFPFVASQRRRFTAVTPKFGINYQIEPSVLIYASATRGYKSGGTNFSATNTAALGFDPETIWSYEAGLKSEFLQRRVRLNVSAFKYDYSGLQIQTLIGPGNVSIGNAASAHVKGLEIEGSAKPVTNLLLTANLALLDASYSSFPQAVLPGPLAPYVAGDPRYSAATNTFNAEGRRLNAAPGSSFSLSGQYDLPVGPGKAFVRGEYYHQSRAYYDPANSFILSQKPYGLVNASIGFNSNDGHWSAQLVGKNLAQARYFIAFGANGIVPAAISGAPRTIAVQLTRSW